jgi:hypothetical protein
MVGTGAASSERSAAAARLVSDCRALARPLKEPEAIPGLQCPSHCPRHRPGRRVQDRQLTAPECAAFGASACMLLLCVKQMRTVAARGYLRCAAQRHLSQGPRTAPSLLFLGVLTGMRRCAERQSMKGSLRAGPSTCRLSAGQQGGERRAAGASATCILGGKAQWGRVGLPLPHLASPATALTPQHPLGRRPPGSRHHSPGPRAAGSATQFPPAAPSRGPWGP